MSLYTCLTVTQTPQVVSGSNFLSRVSVEQSNIGYQNLRVAPITDKMSYRGKFATLLGAKTLILIGSYYFYLYIVWQLVLPRG